MFIVMVFYDWEADNTFFVMYGISWKGIWASGIYFKEVISINLNAYTTGYYVFHWVDDNKQDGIPQSNEINQESQSPRTEFQSALEQSKQSLNVATARFAQKKN